jgi:hypothetical protein
MYRRLIDEHVAIERAAELVASIARQGPGAAAEASAAMERLARLVRDHEAAEDPLLYATGVATRGGRHAEAAADAAAAYELLGEDWAEYLYRWTPEAIAADWLRFRAATEAIVRRLHERLAYESEVLYSLGLFHGILG